MISFPANLWKLKFKWLLSEEWLPKLCFKCWKHVSTKKADRAGIESTSWLKVFVTLFLIVTKYAILSRLLECRELRAFPGTFVGRIPGTLNFYWCVHGGVEREWPWGIASGQSASLKGFLYNTKPTNHQCNEIIRDGSQPSRATLRPAPQVRNCWGNASNQ